MNRNLLFRSRNLSILAALTILLMSFGVPSPAAHAAVGSSSNPVPMPSSRVIPPSLKYVGLDTNWAQWVLSIPADRNPLLDETGANCAEGQSGPVWNLAGNFGGTTTRSCTVPTGKMLYFPVINAFSVNTDGENDQQLRDETAYLMGFIDESTLEADVDGAQIGNLPLYRISRIIEPDPLPVFPVTLPDNNIFGAPAGSYRAVSDGYYLWLSPLTPGLHTIHFHGEAPAFGFTVDVTYNLTVAP